MPRPTYPRSNRRHAEVASQILTRHALKTGVPVTLPVPIELIIEKTYGLEILWDDVEEPAGAVILGALAPRDRRIVLNTRHEDLFETWVGPERFTYAHEFAHWIYDANNPDQFEMELSLPTQEPYCYHSGSTEPPEDHRIREMNANKLAAHLLLPEDLVRQANIGEVLRDLSGTAERWQVSRTALRIRLEDLGLV